MSEVLELILIVIGIAVLAIVGFLATLGIISLPLAFVGWAIASTVSLFTVVSVSYPQSVGIGWVTLAIIGIIKWWRNKK